MGNSHNFFCCMCLEWIAIRCHKKLHTGFLANHGSFGPIYLLNIQTKKRRYRVVLTTPWVCLFCDILTRDNCQLIEFEFGRKSKNGLITTKPLYDLNSLLNSFLGQKQQQKTLVSPTEKNKSILVEKTVAGWENKTRKHVCLTFSFDFIRKNNQNCLKFPV